MHSVTVTNYSIHRTIIFMHFIVFKKIYIYGGVAADEIQVFRRVLHYNDNTTLFFPHRY